MKRLKFLTLVLLIIGISFFLMGFQHTQEDTRRELKRINRQIESERLSWKARETSISKLPPEERRKKLGAFVPLYESPEKYIKVQQKRKIQALLDWRARYGGNYMTAVKNQGLCGSCWAFAVVGIMEAMYNIEQGISETQSVPLAKKINSPNESLNPLKRQPNLPRGTFDLGLQHSDFVKREPAFPSRKKMSRPRRPFNLWDFYFSLSTMLFNRELQNKNHSDEDSVFLLGEKADAPIDEATSQTNSRILPRDCFYRN